MILTKKMRVRCMMKGWEHFTGVVVDHKMCKVCDRQVRLHKVVWDQDDGQCTLPMHWGNESCDGYYGYEGYKEEELQKIEE